MIDLKTLAEHEHEAMLTGDIEKMDLTRLAMRYLALRERYVDYWLSDDKAYGTNKYGTADEMRAEYDADADKTIQEMVR